MFVVIKLGGCNGSGKTIVARAVLELANCKPVSGRKKHEFMYLGEYRGVRVKVLGSYETTCGGMDTISDKNDRLKLLKRECNNAIVFYEGLITGKTYGAMGQLCEQHKSHDTGRWIWAFMALPFEDCVARVLQRRAAKGNDAPFDPERTMRSTYNSCTTLAQKLVDGRLPHPYAVHHLNGKKKPALLATSILEQAERAYHAN